MTQIEFFSLDAQDRREAFRAAADGQGRRDELVEKDLWVVWVLDALFTVRGAPQMAFKGGTSLSKVYNAIQRFSEDVDITLSAVELAPEHDVYPEQMSSKARRRMESLLRERLGVILREVVVPHLRACAERLPIPLAVSDPVDGEVVWVTYPSVALQASGYLRAEGVKIEFGGRNAVEPSERQVVRPFLAQTFPDLALPAAAVDVLAPERTFWEKLTLAHADSRRPEFKNSERLSRHWYDLARLARHDIAERALADWDLLEDVIRVKQLYFRTSYADYGLCLSGGARLLPDAAGLQMLRRDYEQMVRAEMIDDPLEFDDIVSAVGELQRRVNAAAVDRTVRPVAR